MHANQVNEVLCKRELVPRAVLVLLLKKAKDVVGGRKRRIFRETISELFLWEWELGSKENSNFNFLNKVKIQSGFKDRPPYIQNRESKSVEWEKWAEFHILSRTPWSIVCFAENRVRFERLGHIYHSHKPPRRHVSWKIVKKTSGRSKVASRKNGDREKAVSNSVKIWLWACFGL